MLTCIAGYFRSYVFLVVFLFFVLRREKAADLVRLFAAWVCWSDLDSSDQEPRRLSSYRLELGSQPTSPAGCSLFELL